MFSDLLKLFIMQLHGDGSRRAFPQVVKENRVIYVLHSDKDGALLNHISEQECSLVDWILVDSAKGGRYIFFYCILNPFLVKQMRTSPMPFPLVAECLHEVICIIQINLLPLSKKCRIINGCHNSLL